MRNENLCVGQTWSYTYMGFKDQKWSKGAHLEQTRFWERKGGEKGERAKAWEKIKF